MSPIGLAILFMFGFVVSDELRWTLHSQEETSDGSKRYHRVTKNETWQPEKTALIVCDVWDSHHCRRAVLRVEELVPRLEATKNQLRSQGVTIIHAPSDCMKSYLDHPARLRALKTPRASQFPEKIQEWCKQIPSEEKGVYPIDQSNGGEDDEPEEHAAWVKELERQGRNPKTPWLAQHPGITIDSEKDYISDKGEEVWSILQSRGIENVLVAGVHTNMCVLGRPFGLRRMVQAGKRTALFSDLTDTMYDPRCHPFVSHFTGTDLIVDHIEKFVCPTITSDQVLGGNPFRFKDDKRPTVAMLIAEDEYRTEQTLPVWSISELGKNYRLRWVFGSDSNRFHIPGIDSIQEADLLLVSVRRRPILDDELKQVRRFEASGKPMLGIRTASHAFSLRSGEIPEKVNSWPEFDAQVWGGNYSNHYPNHLRPTIQVAQQKQSHPLLIDWGSSPFVSTGSLYKVAPLAKGTNVLLEGSLPGEPVQPVAWTFQRANGGKSFYTSLGHPDDFQDKRFQHMLAKAIDWLLVQSK